MKQLSRFLFVLALSLTFSANLQAKPDKKKGKITEVIVLDGHHSATQEYTLEEEGTGKKYHVKDVDLELKKGSVVEIDGDVSGDAMSGKPGGTQQTSPAPLVPPPPVTGTRSVLIYNISFTDGSSSGCTDGALLNDTLNASNSVNAGYTESSYGTMGFAGDIVDVTIQGAWADPCDYSNKEVLADQAATAQGRNISSYQHHLYIFPQYPSCANTYGGIATISGTNAASFYCHYRDISHHELGHTLGMNHESSDGTGQWASAEYQSPASDTMGYEFSILGDNLVHNNAANKEMLGWMSIPSVSTNGTYVLTEVAAAGAAAIKIPIPGSTSFYYVSFRSTLGLDVNLPSPWPGNTSVHKFDGSVGSHTYAEAALSDAGQFVANGITITQVSHNSSSSTVSVAIQSGPLAPTNLSASSTKKKEIDLAWTRSTSPGITAQHVFRSTSLNGTYSDIATLSATASSYPNTGLSSGTTYYYYVKAYAGALISPPSNIANAVAK